MVEKILKNHGVLAPTSELSHQTGACFIAYWLLAALLTLTLPILAAQAQGKSNLKIMEIKLDPVRQGKNVVHVIVRNDSAIRQVFVVHIQTNSSDYGRGVGWGTQFTNDIGPAESKVIRFAYRIWGPVTNKLKVTFSFYNPTTPETIDWKFDFYRKVYFGQDLKVYQPSGLIPTPASLDQASEITSALRGVQNALKAKKYVEAKMSFTEDFQAINFCRTDAEFLKNVVADDSMMKPYLWPLESLLAFTPGHAAIEEDGRVVLVGETPGQDARIHFAIENRTWKIDEITGYIPQFVTWTTWQEKLLPKLRRRPTAHFDIFYYPASVAEREINNIGAERDNGYEAIAEFLGIKPDVRIRLVLFENGRTKHWETGHQGAGWAFDHTIVEVFNQTERLDPFHEVCHILAHSMGDPPALFNEGLAVYMSERLGAPALKSLGGGTLSVDERVHGLKSSGQWIPLETLVRFTDIGPDESNPTVAYPEAASFVKFLIHRFGREKFFDAYKSLKNTSEPFIQRINVESLFKIFNRSLPELATEWEKAVSVSLL